MKLKKLVAFGMVATMVFSLAACGKNTSTSETKSTAAETTDASADTQSGDSLNGTVVITGSTSVEKIIVDMIDEFQAVNPDVQVNYTGTGSSAGIQDAIDGANTFAVSSRNLKDEETAAGLKTDTFAYDGIAVAVNPENKIQDIKIEDLAKIYSGQITNWKELGGADAEIVVVSREGASGTRDAFEELTGLEDAGGLLESATVVEGNGNVQTTVAGNKDAIGYVSFSFIDDSVKALTLNGVEATSENAKSGEYKLSRPFLFAYQESKLTKEAKAFIDFALSADGQNYVEAHGGIKID